MSDNDAGTAESHNNSAGGSDHPISLIDATISQPQTDEPSRETSPNLNGRNLKKIPTKLSVRDTLARRKYAKWQEGPSSSSQVGDSVEEGQPHDRPALSETGSPQLVQQNGPTGTDVSDFGARPNLPIQDRGRSVKDKKTGKPVQKHPVQYAVDILYENQRGMFFFGIPLYSHSSLLNFDPSPWVTKDLRDSAVNITNAQVPDPSWEWAWKTWYVDMSHDVDEEGWQYSFSFSSQFVWHGTHPWFHSFVRRRRWLRRRVKKSLPGPGGKYGSMKAAHNLTADYFTIHSARDRSPASTLEKQSRTVKTSYISKRCTRDAEAPEEIKDVPSLLKALRLAPIDREKIILVKKFVEDGGEELVYLETQIPDIMSFLVFQNSRRQLLEFLKKTASEAQKHRDEHDAEDRPESEAETRRIDNLLKAVRAADAQIKGLEYWSDRKRVLKTIDEVDDKSEMTGELLQVDGSQEWPINNDPVQEIKGIPARADVGDDSTRRVLPHQPTPKKPKDKGKGRADEATDKEPENGSHESPPRDSEPHLTRDDVMVPVEESVD